MIRVLLPLGLAFIMFSLGLGLKVTDFRQVLRRPGVIATGLAAQMLLLPLIAAAVALWMELPAEWAVGLMILAASPGGVTAGIVTRLALGETALSISLTVLTSLLAFVSVPLIVGAGLGYFGGASMEVRLPIGQAAGGLLLVTLLPVTLGLWFSQRRIFDAQKKKLIHRGATGVFVLIVLFTFVDQWPTIREHFAQLGLACLLLNLGTMGSGALLGGLLGLPAASRVALAMECGIQNSALGITLAVTVLAAPQLAAPSVIYALLMNVTAFAVIGSRRLMLRTGPV
jgi:BASS family bile acid:Na+ symporter